jgi:hypothetical protein
MSFDEAVSELHAGPDESLKCRRATGGARRRRVSTILAGLAVFGDRLGNDAFVIGVRLAAFALILVGAALIPAPFAPVRRSKRRPWSLRALPRIPPEPNPRSRTEARSPL